MKTININNAEPMKNSHGIDAKRIYDTEHAQVVHIELAPGEQLKPHITPVDVFFYVLEGEGVVEIGDETQTVSKDTLIDSPQGIPHCWYNKSDQILRVLVGKVPRPTRKTRVL
ncbi:MAG: cupin domain-containing protein [candidate division KSB1 bacterium]|nr:cupin domain-containing protein [candidate division KSB1 bacterium]